MRKLSIVSAFLVAGLTSSQVIAQEHLVIDGYCQYDGNAAPDDLYGFESDSEAQAAVKRVLDYTGLTQNFNIRAANVPNAMAVIQGSTRSILYNQTFMQNVRNVTATDWAAVSIMAHEVGHHLQGHTIQPGGSRPSIELEADRYSGYVLYRMGATLDQAKAAMNSLSSDTGSETHPPKSARLAAITNGWVAAQQLAQNPPPPVTPPNTAPETQPTTTPATGGSGTPPGPSQPAVTYVARVVFPAEAAVAYYVTSTDDIVARPAGAASVTLVGKRIPPTLPGFAWMYHTPMITYGVLPDGKVMNRNAFGVPFQVGYVTGP